MLFDLDHTIFDFDTSEELAFAEALGVVGIDDAAAHLATYRRLNNALWAAAERGEIRSNQIRNLRFEQLAGELGLGADAATVAGDGRRIRRTGSGCTATCIPARSRCSRCSPPVRRWR